MKKLLAILMSAVMVITMLSATMFTASANDYKEAPLLELGGTVSASYNTESNVESNTEYYIKFIPEETDMYEFKLVNVPSKLNGVIFGGIFDEDIAPVGDGSIAFGAFFGESFNYDICAAKLTAGKTYYLYLSGVGIGKCNVDVTVTKGHTHKMETVTVPASVDPEDSFWNEDGGKYKVCFACGDETLLEKYYYPKTVTLEATKLTYNGKARKPKVTVKDRKGNVIPASNYTVKYSNNKNVGKAKVTVVFNGKKYDGSLVKSFTINPVKTSISSLKAGSKKLTVKWAKKTNQVTGYQIQYSTSAKFSSAKTVTVGKNSTVSKTISGLKGGKKYYVRVRTYKTVKENGSTKKYYSDWSASKSVKVKK